MIKIAAYTKAVCSCRRKAATKNWRKLLSKNL